MKKKVFSTFALLSLSILVLFAVGCGPSEAEIATQTAAAWTATPTNTPIPTSTPTPVPPSATPTQVLPTPTPPPPETIMDNAIAVWEQVEAYHFEISAQIDTTLSGLSIKALLKYSGDYQAPDRFQGTQYTEFLGVPINSEFIIIGETSYTTDATTGEWQKDVESIFPFGPEDLIGLKPSDLDDPVLIDVEELGGILVYHIAGLLRSEEFGGLFGEDEIGIPMEYWISVEDSSIVQIRIEIESLEGSGDLETISVSAMFILSDYGKEVSIEAPNLP